MKTVKDLMLHFMQDMFYAEQQTQKVIREFVAVATSTELKRALEVQIGAANSNIDTLRTAFENLDQHPQGVTCEAILGLLKECDELVGSTTVGSAIRDAGLIACMQAIAHYEKARYGALSVWASAAGDRKSADLFEKLVADVATTERSLREAAAQVAREAIEVS